MARPTSNPELLRVEMPEPLMIALDECAAQSDQTRSAMTRELVMLGLAQRGMWPPEPKKKAA